MREEGRVERARASAALAALLAGALFAPLAGAEGPAPGPAWLPKEDAPWLHDAWTGAILDEGSVVVWTFAADRWPDGDTVRSVYHFTFMRDGKEPKTWTRRFVRLTKDPEPILCVDELVVAAKDGPAGGLRLHYNDPDLDLIVETSEAVPGFGAAAALPPGAPDGARAEAAVWRTDVLLIGSELPGYALSERIRSERGRAPAPDYDRLFLFDEVGGLFVLARRGEERRSDFLLDGNRLPENAARATPEGPPEAPKRWSVEGDADKGGISGRLDRLGAPQPGSEVRPGAARLGAVRGRMEAAGVRRSVFGAAEWLRSGP